jgi:hypothetical protein
LPTNIKKMLCAKSCKPQAARIDFSSHLWLGAWNLKLKNLLFPFILITLEAKYRLPDREDKLEMKATLFHLNDLNTLKNKKPWTTTNQNLRQKPGKTGQCSTGS